ncbi:alkaline phosphatase family protein [Natronomonas amylolytica]|uniref:alkaline phosphatase family protein n=1 Tax=Natronomonas amylolytica TaxID=3108498 RepID=UPI0030093DEF
MTMIVIGLDGFHTNLLEFTPFTQEQFEQGNSGTLSSTQPPVTAPAWASFQTGVNQGKHGVFDFIEYTENYEMEFVDGKKLRAKPVYERLDESGYDCYLQNLPFSMPPRIEGDIMPSWLDGEETEPMPPDLTDKYNVRRPVYPDLDGDHLENIEEMADSFKFNSEIFTSILDEGDHDFYFFLVSVTDWLQHEAYDSLISEPNSEIAQSAKGLLGSVDSFVKKLFSNVSNKTDILLLSDHGFRLYEGAFFVNDWLAEQGYLNQSADGVRFTTKNETDSTIVTGGDFGRWIRNRWFWKFLRPLKNAVERGSEISFSAEQGINLDKTIVYCRSKDEKAIRVNESYIGNDKVNIEGIVAELDEDDRVSANLGSNLYSGPYTDEGGEIILKDETHLVKRGPVGEVATDETIAHHAQEGIIIGSGPSFSDDPENASLVDVMPTILLQFGLPIPEYLDGKVLAEFIDKKNANFIHETEYDPKFYSKSESSEEVQDRLENLGYLN